MQSVVLGLIHCGRLDLNIRQNCVRPFVFSAKTIRLPIQRFPGDK